MRLLLAAAAFVLFMAVPSDASMSETYDMPGAVFLGYGCEPTPSETSVQTKPRADIMGLEVVAAGAGGAFADRVIDAKLNGGSNSRTDPEAVLGNPRSLDLVGEQFDEFDREDVASLGRAGYVLVQMEEVITNANGDDLIIWEAAAEGGVAEPFCVYGASNEEGPYAFVGLWMPEPSSGMERASFDLQTNYIPFSGETSLEYLMVMDSGQSDLILEPNMDIARPDDYTLTTVTFTDVTPDPADRLESWRWDLGDGTIIHQDRISWAPIGHSYDKAGTYTVCLYVEDDAGVSGTSCRDLVVENRLPQPLIDGPAGLPRDVAGTFLGLGSDADGTIVSWSWDMGDGTTYTTRDVDHAYDALGAYKVSLTVVDDDGAAATVTHLVDVGNIPPVASFEILPYASAPGSLIQFNDLSTDADGTIEAWSWDLGDGTMKTDQHPDHAYAALGTYPVTLTVTDNDGRTDATTQEVVIDNLAPLAIIEGPVKALTLEDVSFTDASYDPDGTIVSALWTLPDGTTTASPPTYSFPDDGSYSISLTVEDDDGVVVTGQHMIEIMNRPPDVTIWATEEPDTTRVSYAFDYTATDVDGNIVLWSWDFGDGIVAIDPVGRHAYASPGTYPVSLTVTDDDGDTATHTIQIVVTNESPWPEIGRWAEPEAGEGAVQFQDLSRDLDGAIVGRHWVIEGHIYSDSRFIHTFADPHATYAIALRVTDDFGIEMRTLQYITPAELGTVAQDGDGDGALDEVDNCPAVHNDQRDLDGDGLGDACDEDMDGDGVPQGEDAFPEDASESADADGDGIGDNADDDDDNDGLKDTTEIQLGLDPYSADSDGDGIADADELAHRPEETTQDVAGWPISWEPLGPEITSYEVWRVGKERVLVGIFDAGPANFTAYDAGAGPGDHHEIIGFVGSEPSITVKTSSLPCGNQCASDAATPRWPWFMGGSLVVAGGIGAVWRFRK